MNKSRTQFVVFYMNKSEIPSKVTIAPNISFGNKFSLNAIIDTGISNIGVIDVMAETIPVDTIIYFH